MILWTHVGCGLHVSHLAQHFPNISWRPSEIDRTHWPSLLAYLEDAPNILPPWQVPV
jgi:Protein of unknown function (DUF938)